MLAGGEFKAEFSRLCENLNALGCSDAFVHCRAFSDSLFNSKYYPQKENTLSYGFDILEYMIAELKAVKVRFHAWINPFRTANGDFSNPADISVQTGVLCGIREIIENYDVDGVHFDDYFYPANSDETDSETFAEYESAAVSPLEKGEWRRANITSLVFAARDIIKESKKDIIFSISPAADNDKNYNSSFADVKAWCESGAVDYIIPQLYFGFDYPDESFTFGALLKKWKKLSGGAKLIIGLAAYKLGTDSPPDSEEWQSGEDILARQTEICLKDTAVSGVCYFSCTYLFAEDTLHAASTERIIKTLKKRTD